VISKIVLLFLVFIGVLGMFGKLKPRKLLGLQAKKRCDSCGRPKIGKGPCPCKRSA
jgi:hypothetical protein